MDVDNNLSSKLDLFVSLKNVPKLDVMSPSDPFVVFSIRNNQNEQYQIFEYSEIVWDNSNPDFVKQIQIDYLFEEVQRIKLDFYDADTENQYNLKDHDFIGTFEFLVGDLVTASGQKLTGQLRDKGAKVSDSKKRPCIASIRCEEISNNRNEIELQFSAEKLPKMDWFFGKCDGYLTLYRGTEDGGWAAVAQTNVVKKNYNPVWAPLKISVQRLCNGDEFRPILIRAFDWSPNAEPDYIGEVQTTFQDLESQVSMELREVTNGKRGKKSRGTVKVPKCVIRERASFLDYVMGGLDIQLMVAIDFTASNGDPNDPTSLHYMHSGENQYSAAIRAVGAVLEPYDSDNMIPCWGFGGKNRNGQVRHCFPLNGNENDPEVQGMAGVLTAYRQALNQYKLSGPTLFSEIIGTSAMLSTYPQGEEQHFTLLLIITDGVINDQQKTIDSIVSASLQPMAIIIVGVGNANFDTMDVLDADDEPLVSTRGVKAQADIVQFVPFNKYRGRNASLLSKEVLMEVPDQVTGWFERQGIKPKPKKEAVQQYQSYGSLPDVKRMPTVDRLFNKHASAPNIGGMNPNPPPPAYNNKASTLPPGWEQCQDQGTGRTYYVNHNDQSTHWDLPPQMRHQSMY